MISEINLTVDELETIIAIINELNPMNEGKLGAGRATITCDNSSGIGSVVKVSIPMTCGNYYGEFTTVITDEENW
jgi:hypothetical protein